MSCARRFDRFDSVSSYFKVDKYLGFRSGDEKTRNVFIGGGEEITIERWR